MKSFSQFSKGKGITFVDIDDTLLYTTAFIDVIGPDGKVKRSLSNTEFNNYILKPDEEFGFGQFKSSQILHDTSKPNKKMIAKINGMLDYIEQKGHGSEVHILTARAPMDDNDLVMKTFAKHGLRADKLKGVIMTGDTGLGVPHVAKKKVIRSYLQSGNYNRVRLFDDSKKNLDAFLELESEFPEIEFMAWTVGEDGKPRRYN